MATSHPCTRKLGKSSALPAGIAALLGLASPSAMAIPPSTVYVDTCFEGYSTSNSTHGSLRWAVANVADGGTVDATGLGCSTISLQTGAIDIANNDLRILGPGMDALNIRAKYNNALSHTRVFNHTGTGSLKLYDLEVSKGYFKNPSSAAKGGCIISSGNVYLYNVYATACQVLTDSSSASGGAIYATGRVKLKYSTLSDNTADGGASGTSRGGAVFARDGIGATSATVKYNSATGDTDTHKGFGGGLNFGGSGVLLTSTVSGNTATQFGGGIDSFDYPPASSFALLQSTVSGNYAQQLVGGVYSNATSVTLLNSTVAFNSATTVSGLLYDFSPGFAATSLFSAQYITLQSSLLSNNTYGGSFENDVSIINTGSYVTTFNPGPANNLVRASPINNCFVVAKTQSPTIIATCLPYDTLRNVCPLLGTLRDNGGLTSTHALSSGSPAIDSGANPFSFSTDQRGTGYPRVSNLVADIGAYEVQQDDIVFNANFEGCPPLF